MKKSTINAILIGLMIISVLYVIFLYPKLPAELPMQFSLTGEVNWSAPKLAGIMGCLGIEGIVMISAIVKKESELSSLLVFIFTFVLMMGFLSYIAFFM